MVFASGVKKYPRSSRKLTVPWESTVTFVTRPAETGLFSFYNGKIIAGKTSCVKKISWKKQIIYKRNEWFRLSAKLPERLCRAPTSLVILRRRGGS